MNKNLAVKLEQINKKYTLHHEKPTLMERLLHGRNEEFYALRNVSLDIAKGDQLGIVGANGSGKTTLLKIIAGITAPTSGFIKTWGKIVSLIDIEAGFHADLTGEQNIYINGMLLGMNNREIKKNLDRIISFADIGSFIDVPLYTYSQGMKLRLGFAVAVHAQPEILILDEGLSGGDRLFQKKSMEKISEFYRARKTIIFVSHWLELIERMCKRIVVLDRSRLIANGGIKVLYQYHKGNL